MKLMEGIELLARILMQIIVAERTHPARSGPSKHSFVLSNLKPELERPRSPSILELGDLNEILETIGAIVSLVVKLFNLLGVFKKSDQGPTAEGD